MRVVRDYDRNSKKVHFIIDASVNPPAPRSFIARQFAQIEIKISRASPNGNAGNLP